MNPNEALAVSRITQNDQIDLLERGWEMKVLTSLLAAALLLADVGSSYAAIRIAGDRGGQIGKYISKFQRLHSSGESVVIDGLCASACTLVLAAVPRDKICVTSRAALGFHAAYDFGLDGRTITNPIATEMLYSNYPTGLALLELDRLRSELHRHHDLSGRVGLPPRADGLLLGDGLALAVDLRPPLGGPDVVGVLQEQLLLLQLGDEIGPPDLDDVVVGLREGGEGKRLEDWHVGFSLVGTNPRDHNGKPKFVHGYDAEAAPASLSSCREGLTEAQSSRGG
jgi:hypothetical protein